MTEPLLLALDGGQSGTLAIVGTAAGRVLGAGFGGPILHHDEVGAELTARRSVVTAVESALAQTERAPRIASCCISMTGSADFAERVISERFRPERIDVLGSDAIAALAAGAGRAVGLVVIAGTGSVAYAANRNGRSVDRGGWGWFMGDEGSGFWIANQALRAAALGLDGVGPSTRLTELLPALLGVSTLREVYNIVTGGLIDRPRIAALARPVIELAMEGDGVAAQILDGAAQALERLVVGTATAAPWLGADERTVVFGGGVLSPTSPLAAALGGRLTHSLPGFTVAGAGLPPVAGAYFLSLQAAGLEVGPSLMTAVGEQLERLGIGMGKAHHSPHQSTSERA